MFRGELMRNQGSWCDFAEKIFACNIPYGWDLVPCSCPGGANKCVRLRRRPLQRRGAFHGGDRGYSRKIIVPLKRFCSGKHCVRALRVLKILFGFLQANRTAAGKHFPRSGVPRLRRPADCPHARQGNGSHHP
jgi:hypothetical protein